MHGHLEISGPNHPKGGVQYRNQGPTKGFSKIRKVNDRLNQHLIHTATQTSLIKTSLRGCCTLLQLSPPAPRPLLKF